MRSTIYILVALLAGCAGTVDKPEDFEKVTNSLNTPELISKYQQQNFSYAQTWEGYGCGGVNIYRTSKACPPRYIYDARKGNCAAYARFAQYALKKAGYESWIVRASVTPPASGKYSGPKNDMHYVTVFKYKDKDAWGVIDNGWLRTTNDPHNIPDRYQQPYKITDIERD